MPGKKDMSAKARRKRIFDKRVHDRIYGEKAQAHSRGPGMDAMVKFGGKKSAEATIDLIDLQTDFEQTRKKGRIGRNVPGLSRVEEVRTRRRARKRGATYGETEDLVKGLGEVKMKARARSRRPTPPRVPGAKPVSVKVIPTGKITKKSFKNVK